MAWEVGPERFEEEILDASKRRPVVVDFWAPWCAPCVQLAPILAELEAESSGRWTLAKVNVEEHPLLAQAFRISGIPALKAFRDGALVAETQGLATKAQLQAWLGGFVPGEEVELMAAAREAEARGDDAAAEPLYRAALELRKGREEASLGLAGVLERTGRLEEAAELVALLDGAVAARIRLQLLASEGPSLEEARVAAETGEPSALHALAVAEALAGHHAAAMDLLLELIRRNPDWRDEAGRKTLLELFQLASSDEELVEEYRRRLAMLLY